MQQDHKANQLLPETHKGTHKHLRIAVNDIEIDIPTTLAEYPLCQRILFQREHGDILDAMLKDIAAMKEGLNKDIEFAGLQLESCYRGFAFWSNVDLDTIKDFERCEDIAAVWFAATAQWNEYKAPKLQTAYQWRGELWRLPEPHLKQGSRITFGEFIDSKQVIKNAQVSGKNKWEIIQELAVIYFRRDGEAYEESFMHEGSDRLKLMQDLPLDYAIAVGAWFDDFSEYIGKYFPVFHKSRGKAGKNLDRHFDRWGWINFLKSISKTKEFDIQGSNLNSIDCARKAWLFDVLLYASEAKEYAEASNADQEILYRQKKSG